MKKIKYIGLSILLLTLIVSELNFSISLDMTSGVKEATSNAHRLHLHTLALNGESIAEIRATKDVITITNGIVAGVTNEASSQSATIGGGQSNKIIDSTYAGIGGGTYNEVSKGNNSIIGGGRSNIINGNNAAIAGGTGNKAGEGGTIVGGGNNTSQKNGIILGGFNNSAYNNSLALGKDSVGTSNSFARNANADTEKARINTDNGFLIGTTDIIKGVKVVVNGAIKLGGNNVSTEGKPGEIKFVEGCFYAYDGEFWHNISADSNTVCPWDKDLKENNKLAIPCEYGNILIQPGDKVSAYNTQAGNCIRKTVVCSQGELKTVEGNLTGYIYPYCYGNTYGGSCAEEPSREGYHITEAENLETQTPFRNTPTQRCSKTFKCFDGTRINHSEDETCITVCPTSAQNTASCNTGEVSDLEGATYKKNYTYKCNLNGSKRTCNVQCPNGLYRNGSTCTNPGSFCLDNTNEPFTCKNGAHTANTGIQASTSEYTWTCQIGDISNSCSQKYCTYNNQKYQEGQSINTYSVTQTTITSSSSCDSYKRTSTCHNGKRSIEPYSYATCGNQCYAGSYGQNGNCESCGGGKRSNTGATSSSACQNINAGCYGSGGSNACPNTCPAGTYSNAGASSCSNCQKGEYSETGAVACIKCPAGYYCPTPDKKIPCGENKRSNEGSTAPGECKDLNPGCYGSNASNACPNTCPAGTYVPEGNTSCLDCPTGTYSLTGSSLCTTCHAGYYCPTPSEEIPCGPGKRSNEGSTNISACKDIDAGCYGSNASNSCPNKCPAGQYSNAGADKCSACSLGQYSEAGSPVCITCPAGYYCPNTHTKTPCGPGKRSNEGSTNISACKKIDAGCYGTNGSKSCPDKCPAGNYSAEGSASCTACAPGTYTGGIGASFCGYCEINTYSSGTGATVCTPCPTGEHTSGTGASSCSNCDRGYYCNGGNSKPCPNGYTSDSGATTESQCYINVSAGKYIATAKSSNQTDCAPGKYSTAHTVYYGKISSCDTCSAGSYTDKGNSTGATKCTSCTAGYYCNGKTRTPCGDGKYSTAGATSCSNIDAGCYGSNATNSCPNKCRAGYYSYQGLASCIPCAAGTYTGGVGASSCSSCPTGTYTSSTGSTSCIPCTPGKYASSAGSTSCTSCPIGTYSTAGASSCTNICIQSTPWCNFGIPSSAASYLNDYTCSQGPTTCHCPNNQFWNGEQCLSQSSNICGMTHNSCNTYISDPGSENENGYYRNCIDGYGRVQASCKECKTGSHSNGDKCEKNTCKGTLPEHTQTNTTTPPNNTTNWYYDNTLSLSSACSFKCEGGYSYNSSTNICDRIEEEKCSVTFEDEGTKTYEVGTSISSYSTKSNCSCSSYIQTSKCTDGGTWDKTPYQYKSCSKPTSCGGGTIDNGNTTPGNTTPGNTTPGNSSTSTGGTVRCQTSTTQIGCLNGRCVYDIPFGSGTKSLDLSSGQGVGCDGCHIEVTCLDNGNSQLSGGYILGTRVITKWPF